MSPQHLSERALSDITEISRMLSSRAQSVAEYLLPRGRKEGQEWRVGSVAGEPGQSLGVHLAGHKAGVWAEFNSGEAGDLLDLWQQVRGVSLSQALTEAREWLGVKRQEPYREPKRDYVRPPKPSCAAPQNRVKDYLQEDRNIPAEIIARYKIGEWRDEIIFPFLLPDGTLAMAKSRKAEDGASPKPTAANCEPVLFGWQAIPESAREIILTEGEIDALSWAAYGLPAMSIPYGGGGGAKQRWIESEFERMERFEKIYISTDMDKEGEAAADEIANRLGRHRCLRVNLPYKDANECRMNGLPDEEMRAALTNAKHLDPEGLRRASDFAAAVSALFWPAHDTPLGYRTPYKKLGDKLLFRPAELTLWTGASGGGKSQILSDCIVDWVSQGSRVCLSSLEMKPEQSLKRMCKQTVGVDRPTDRAIYAALSWLDNGLLLYERVGKAGVTGLLEIFSFARAKYGCDQFVIDSLMRLGIDPEDYSAQEKALFQLVDWVLTNNVHLHLVAHSRKGGRDQGVPETEDVKGAMEIGANAFNIIAVWRNKGLEDQIGAAKTEEEKRVLGEKPGVILNVAKQRNGDYEGKVGLWFNKENYQYQSSYDRSEWNRRYLPRAEVAA